MRKFLGILFFVLTLSAFSQKTEVGRDTSDKIIPHPITPYDPKDTLFAHYEYQKAPVPDNIIARTERDSSFDLSYVLKFNLTSLLANKASIGFEKVFNYKFSWELSGSYIFANPLYDGPSQNIWPNISFKNQGGEGRFGLNLIVAKPYLSDGNRLHSHGIFISYRYQHASNVDFSTDGKGGQGYHYNYKVSQTKNLIGIFYRKRRFNSEKKLAAETFYEVGFYAGMARTVCFSYAGSYGDDTGEPMDVKSVGMPMENGFVFAPVLRLGMAIRYNKH